MEHRESETGMEAERHPRKCSATKRGGEPCGRWAIAGGTVCPTHGGSTGHIRQKAAERQSQKAVLKALGEIPDEQVDPAQALLWLVSAKFAEVHWLRGKVQEVPASSDHEYVENAAGWEKREQKDTLTWGKTKEESGTGPLGPIDSTVHEAAPNIWWKLLREAEDQLAKYSTAALRAGVERRQIELQEAHALHLAQAITRILDQLGLSQDQARLVPTVVPAVLRSLPVAGGEGKS